MKNTHWKLIDRKSVYKSKFVEVYEDEVQLPDNAVIKDYTVIKKPDIVIVIATVGDKVLMIHEYKYAADAVMKALPAGHLKKDEEPTEAARRELLEETGYSGDDFAYLGILREYASKDLHQVHVVLAKDVQKVSEKNLDPGEENTLSLTTIEAVKREIIDGQIQSSSAIAALAMSGLLF